MINIAIIGTGYWGPNYANVISENPGLNLCYCCDISEKALSTIKQKYPGTKTTTNLKEVLSDKKIQAVIIAVPASKHYEVASLALKAGKHVLIEKPLATDPKQAKELVKLAQKKELILLVDHIYLYNPAVLKIRELIVNKELGSIYYSHGDFTALGPVRVDVSAMTDLAVHFLYTICYLLNKTPTSISAFGKAFLTPDNIDVAFINVEFKKNTIFNLRVSWLDPIKTRSLILIGTKKMVAFDDTKPDKVTIYDRGINKDIISPKDPSSYTFTFRYGDVILPQISNAQPLKIVVQSFIEAVTKKVKEQDSSMAVNMVTLLEAAEYSLKHHGQKIIFTKNHKTGILSFKKS